MHPHKEVYVDFPNLVGLTKIALSPPNMAGFSISKVLLLVHFWDYHLSQKNINLTKNEGFLGTF